MKPLAGLLRPRRLAVILAAAAALEVAAAIGFSFAAGWSWREALEAFVVTNSVMGASFAICGLIIAWHRPGNAIGWLFIADGLGHATSAAAAPFAQWLADSGSSVESVRVVLTIFAGAWPWSIALFLPLALLLFPEGRLPSPRWRPVAAAIVGTSPLFVLDSLMDPTPVAAGFPASFFAYSDYDRLQPLWMFAEIRTSGALILAAAGLVVRFRRSEEIQRRQLLWLLVATIAAVALILPWSFIAGTPIIVLFAIPLIPAAVAVAIVRHQLLDIRLVLSRALVWVLLSLGAVAVYGGLVLILDRFVSATLGRSAVATVAVALVMAPMLPRIQRLADRAVYGQRQDPARIASTVGKQLSGPEQRFAGVVAAVRQALRLPYVALQVQGDIVAAQGARPSDTHSFSLAYAGEKVGELIIGLRAGEKELSLADENVLSLVGAPLAAAVHATGLSAELQASRKRIVAAREEERRRLRRDLHDGLGPTLTGLALAADAAANLVDVDAPAARKVLGDLGRDARAAIVEVRRLVDDLRPKALDEHGLVEAVRRQAKHLSRGKNGAAIRVDVQVEGALPPLPAAVESAAYRIATEAITNVARHSKATGAVVKFSFEDVLLIDVEDDGGRQDGAWREGVGLSSMRERVAELGGACEAGPGHRGGRIHISLPIGGA